MTLLKPSKLRSSSLGELFYFLELLYYFSFAVIILNVIIVVCCIEIVPAG